MKKTIFIGLSIILLAGCAMTPEEYAQNQRAAAAFAGGAQALRQSQPVQQPMAMPTNKNCTVYNVTPTQTQVYCD